MASRECIFKAKTTEAYTVKTLTEVLQNILTDVCFIFDKNGIKLLTVDNKKPPHLLVHLKLDGEKFVEYHCPKPLKVGINLQHFYKQVKSIKKKDQITLFISKGNPKSLEFVITKSEIDQPPVMGYVVIQTLSDVMTAIPEKYEHPIHISTRAFQNTCKDLQNFTNKVRIYAKGLHFSVGCDTDGIHGRKIPFGGELDIESTEEEYEDTFHLKNLSNLTKVSGLNARMQVYIPPSSSDVECPLKIAVAVGTLGKLEVFIKSISQLE